MSKYLGYRDGGKTNEEGLYRFIAKLFKTGVPGLDSASTTLEVSQRGAGANMSVDIAIGDALIPYSTYLFTGFTDAIENVSVDAADPSNPRKDIVVAYVDLSVVDDTDANNPDAFKFKAVAGTPAGSPTFPNDAAIQASIGGSNPWVELAGIDVDAADTSVTDSMITDRREPVSLMTRLWGGALNTIGHLVPNVADDTVALLAAAQTLLNKTLTAPILNNPTINGFNGWQELGDTPDTVAAHASIPDVYTLTFNGVDLTSLISQGQFLETARTVAAPILSAIFNGSSNYLTKSSPAGTTFTDDWAVGGWVKLAAYPTSGGATIISRYNGTSGWLMKVTTQGLISMEGYNGGSGNISYFQNTKSLPLNRWVHIGGQLDMSGFTNSPTASYMMYDGVDHPVNVSRAGTNPTTLAQAGNIEIGSQNGGAQLFNGKIAQLALYGAKVSQSVMADSRHQPLTGAETNLISAWSLANSLTDLNTTNANNLTNSTSTVINNADSPFGNNGVSSTKDYAEILQSAFSTNTTAVVRVPNGCTLPISGGISSVKYANSEGAYKLPAFSKRLGRAIITRQDYTNTTVTTEVDVPGMTFSIWAKKGKTIELEAYAQRLVTTGATNIGMSLFEGGTQLQQVDTSVGSNVNQMPTIKISLEPTEGLHTYKLCIHQSGAGTMRLGANGTVHAEAALIAKEV